MGPFTKLFILKQEWIIDNISYECLDYESVNDEKLSQVLSPKSTKRQIHEVKG